MNVPRRALATPTARAADPAGGVKSPVVIARNPYVQNVRDLIRHPGDMRERRLEFAAPEHLGEGLVAVAEGTELDIDLKLESLHEGVLASGSVQTQADGECARCLAPVSLPIDVEFAGAFRVSFRRAVRLCPRGRHARPRAGGAGRGGAGTALPARMRRRLPGPRPRSRHQPDHGGCPEVRGRPLGGLAGLHGRRRQRRRDSHGGSEAPQVPREHARAPLAVEGRGPHAGQDDRERQGRVHPAPPRQAWSRAPTACRCTSSTRAAGSPTPDVPGAERARTEPDRASSGSTSIPHCSSSRSRTAPTPTSTALADNERLEFLGDIDARPRRHGDALRAVPRRGRGAAREAPLRARVDRGPRPDRRGHGAGRSTSGSAAARCARAARRSRRSSPTPSKP